MPGPLTSRHGSHEQELGHITAGVSLWHHVAIPVLGTIEWSGWSALGGTVLQDEVLLGENYCPGLEGRARSPRAVTAVAIPGLGEDSASRGFILKA